MAQVVITDKRAVYVNDCRITDRSTKWGVHYPLYEFEEDGIKAIIDKLQEYENSGGKFGRINLNDLSAALDG